jgi:O-antigen chain-terminating methyltransferase
MSDPFYKAFEDQFRGSRELIKERLRAYQPFIEALNLVESRGKALDLGCGRGEWLELLGEYDFDASGIDLDEGMLSDCKTLGLKVEKGNALDKLASQANESLVLISGFHLAEHLSNTDLQKLIKESYRALKPGGLLILETPNTENITVATINFYFDPSHLRPIPAKLLQFLTQYIGFTRTRIIGLQESIQIRDNPKPPTLFQVLNEASPDYAVIAQKAGDVRQMMLFDEAFSRNFGLSLDGLAARYDAGIQGQLNHTNHQMQEMQRLLRPFIRIMKLKEKLLSWLK